MTAAEAGDVIHKLYRWGADSKLNKAPNGYPSQTGFARMMVNPGESADRANLVTPLDDAEHERIDRIVSEMMATKPLHRKILILFYIERKGDRKIAQKLRMSREVVAQTRREGESHIEALL